MNPVRTPLPYLVLAVAALAALSLSGCATVPAETSLEPSVLAFDVERADAHPEARFGVATVVLRSADNRQLRRSVVLHPHDDVATLSGLPSGTYTVESVCYRMAGSGVLEHLEVPKQTVEVGTEDVSVYSYAFVFGASGEGSSVDLRPLSESRVGSLEEELSGELDGGGHRVSAR